MRLVLHNHFPHTKFMVLPPRANAVLRKAARDANFTDSDAWYKAVFAKYPKANIQEERLASGGFAKVAFVDNRVVGKYSFAERKSGWVTDQAARDARRFPGRRKTRDVADYVGDDGKVHKYINDDPKQGPCGCGYYAAVDSKPDEYLVRVDEHLKTLDPAAKKKFLQKQRVDFERRYTDFMVRARRNSGNIGPNESREAY